MKTLISNVTSKRLTALVLALIFILGTAGIPTQLTQAAPAGEGQVYEYLVSFVGFGAESARPELIDTEKNTNITGSTGIKWDYRAEGQVHVAKISSTREKLVLEVGGSGALGAYGGARMIPLWKEYPVAFVQNNESFAIYLKPEATPGGKMSFAFASTKDNGLNIKLWADGLSGDDLHWYNGPADAGITTNLGTSGPTAYFRAGVLGAGTDGGSALDFKADCTVYFALKTDATDWQWRLGVASEGDDVPTKYGVFNYNNWPPPAGTSTIEDGAQIPVGKTQVFKLNYYQYPPAKYDDWNVWLWPKGEGGKVYYFDSYTPDSEGWITLTAKIPEEWAEIGIIVKLGDWDDKSNSMDIMIPLKAVADGITEVWHVHGENRVYTSKGEVNTDPKPVAALADAPGQILVTMNCALSDFSDEQLRLFDIAGNKYVDVFNEMRDDERSIIVSTDHPGLAPGKASTLSPNKQYEVRYSTGDFSDYKSCDVTMRNILNSYATTATDLGLSWSAANSRFKVWAPTATSVEVAIYQGIKYGDGGDYDYGNGKIKTSKLEAPDSTLPMTRDDATGVWTCTAPGNLKDQYYMYKVTLPGGKVNYAVDPYARAVSANGQLGAIIDPGDPRAGTVKPLNKEAANARNKHLNNDTDHIIYEMHVRDFTIHSSSGATNAGKYLGAGETGTTIPGTTVVTGIDHLVELGVTTVHLLPIFDGASVNELGDLSYDAPGAMNWGYDPQNYNVPEGAYSTDPTDPYARISELKALISAMHEKGIRVVMDVVYNHTYSIADGPFEKIVPGYFYRTWDNGNYSNGSGCGNETASERAMVSKFMIESLLYWQKEFGMDGFRFDLMALHDIDTMCMIAETLKKVDPSCVIYGEPWVAGETPLPGDKRTTNGRQFGNGFAIFNDDVREAIRGNHETQTKMESEFYGGFAGGALERNGNAIEGLILDSVKASYGHLSRASESITYTSKHDNLILFDLMQRAQGTDIHAYHGKEDKTDKWDDTYAKDPYVNLGNPLSLAGMGDSFSANAARSSLLAVGLVMTIQGIPFIHAGDEILRTKFGNGNSYNTEDYDNAIRWENKIRFSEIFDYQKGLIQLRNLHPAFRMDSKAVIATKITEIYRAPQVAAYKLGEFAGGDDWKNIYVAYNGSGAAKAVTFGNTEPLTIVVNDTKAGVDSRGTIAAGASHTLPPFSMVVAYDVGGGYGEPVLSGISLSPSTSSVYPGESVPFALTYLDQMGNEYFGTRPEAVWSSDDTGIATVSQNGVATGVERGTTTIKVTVGSYSASATVDVVPQRYLVIQYDSPTASQADVHTWGAVSGMYYFTAMVDGFWSALFPIPPNTTQVNYIIRKISSEGWGENDSNKNHPDDQFVAIAPDRTFTIIRVGVGQDGHSDRQTVDDAVIGIPPEHVDVNGFSGEYDGAGHGIQVMVRGGGAVTYSTEQERGFGASSPNFTQAGTYTIYFRIDRGSPWAVYTGTGTVTITGGPPSSSSPSPSDTNPGTIPGDGGMASIPVPVTINAAKGEVEIKPDAKMIETLIADAKEHGRGITFDLSGVASAKAAIFNVSVAKAIGDAGDSLTIKFPGSAVNFDADALEKLAGASSDGATPITVRAELVPMGELKGMQAAQAYGLDTVISVEVFVGSAKLDVPITISLPYKLKTDEDPAAVCAWHLGDSGSLTRLSGKYDATSGIITFVTGHQSYFVVGYDPVVLWENVFNDVSANASYYDAVAYANYYGIFVGDGLGRFMPADSMTRAMFARVLWNIEGQPAPNGEGGFSDVPGGLWYTDAIAWAAKNGIVSGVGDGLFEPKRAVNRQEMLVMLSGYAEFKGYAVPKNREAPEFSDKEQIADWAEGAVKSLSEAGVINATNGALDPTGVVNRAEVAGVLKDFIRFIALRGSTGR